MNWQKKQKKPRSILTGLFVFAMTVSYFYAPGGSLKKESVAEAATTAGQTWEFNYTGAVQTFTVPETGYYELETWGASGGTNVVSHSGGKGGYARGFKLLTKGEAVGVYVGQQGWYVSSAGTNTSFNGGGGGLSSHAKGGGATDIRVGGTALTNRILVAGGGGGTYGWTTNSQGGHGGGLNGQDAVAGSGGYLTNIGKGGTQSAGGVKGGDEGTANNGTNGSLGVGGYAGYWSSSGGGGGGYYGGGGGNHPQSGGGGSSYIGGVLAGKTMSGETVSGREGNGLARIKYLDSIEVPKSNVVYNQSRTFNNTGTGALGANTNKSAGILGGSVAMSGGMYNWTVPDTGYYRIEVFGAQGGDATERTYFVGNGAQMRGDFYLAKGQVLKILVGQQGEGRQFAGGGGGGTFVTTNTNSPLIVAGGGAGENTYGSYNQTTMHGQVTTKGGDTSGGSYQGGNSGAAGGGVNQHGGGNGGGLIGSGYQADATPSPYYAQGGTSFVNGGKGGTLYPSYQDTGYGGSGGFGGGGNGGHNGGGGGGYSGGAGGFHSSQSGGGGGSYNSGSNPSSAIGVRTGHGMATITYISPTVTQSPSNGTKFQNNYIDLSWSVNKASTTTVQKYELRAGTTSGGTNLVPLTNKGANTSQRINVPVGTPGNTTIYWQVRVYDQDGLPGPWKESTVIYSNNVPTITASTNVPAKLDVSLEKRNHAFSINSLKDTDDFNYVTLFADVLDKNGTVVAGSKKQIVLDSSLVSSAQLINDATEKKGSLQGSFDYKTPFNLKVALQPNFANGTFDLTLTKADGVTNVVKSGQKLLTGRTMQPTSASTAESYTLRIYPEDRQNTNALSAAPLAGVNEVTGIMIPFTADTRNYLPNLTNVKNDVASRVFSDAEGFNRISVTGHVDDLDPADKVTMYYEVQPKATNYSIQVTTSGGKVIPRYGKALKTFNPKVDADFAFTYQVPPDLDSGNYALLVYGYDSQEGIGDYKEVPFTVNRGGPTIDFVSEYVTTSGAKVIMSSAQKQIVAEDNKTKLYFTPNNYATFEYAGYLVRGGTVKDLRIRGAFTNDVKASFVGVDFGKDPITLMNGEKTDFKLGDIVVFKFKATSATGIVTEKDVRILIGDDSSKFGAINDANMPRIP